MLEKIVESLQEANSARREGNADLAKQAFQHAFEASKFSGDALGRLFALKGLAQLERDGGRPGKAVEFLAEAVQLAQEAGDLRLQAHTLRHYAEALMETEHLEIAAPVFSEALELYRGLPDVSSLELANALRPAALLYELLAQHGEAQNLWREARELYARSELKAGVVECDKGLSRCSVT